MKLRGQDLIIESYIFPPNACVRRVQGNRSRSDRRGSSALVGDGIQDLTNIKDHESTTNCKLQRKLFSDFADRSLVII